MGLKYRWDLWISKDSIAVISVRGTTLDPVSWLANFLRSDGAMQVEISKFQ
jgi:hypothetical protein